MAHKLMVAVFGSVDAADQAKAHLLEAGVADDRIALSMDLTADGIAAEYPGQSYSNQPGQTPGSEPEHCSDAAHAGTCVLRVDVGSIAEGEPLEAIVRRCGARDTSFVA